MALFSDMLPYLLQQQALPGGPNLGAPIAKSPTNVTALNMPSAKLPGTMDFLNAANNFSNVMGENMLRQQQAHLSDLQAQHLKYQLSIMPQSLQAQLDAVDAARGLPGQQGAAGTGVGSGTPGVSGSSGGTSAVSLPTGGDGIVAPDKLYSFATSIGATPNEAAMLTAAPGVESGYNPSATHDAAFLASKGLPPGYGLYGHNGERLASMQQMAGSQTPGWQDQVKFALQEMRNQGFSDQANAAKTPEELAKVQMGFERPNTNIRNGDYDKRVAYTRQVMQQFGGQGSQTAAVPQPPAPGESNNVNTPTTPVGQQPEGANMVYDPVSKTTVDANTGRALGEIAPEEPAPEEPKEGDQSALTPAGAAIAAGMNKQVNLSPREQLNQAILAQTGGGQVAGDNAAPSGQFGAGNVIPQAMSGQFPALPSSALGIKGANLSAPFSQAAQAAASPAPGVPYGGNAPKTPGPALPAPAPMPQGGAAQGATIDPTYAALLKASILARFSGLPDSGLLRAYEQSPAFAAQKAQAVGNVEVGLAGPKAEAQKAVELKYAAAIAAASKGAEATAGIKALLAEAEQQPVGSLNKQFLLGAAAKMAGMPPVLNMRAGSGANVLNFQTGQYEPGLQQPNVPAGYTVGRTAGGEPYPQEMQGGLPAVQNSATAHEAGAATFRPHEFHGPFPGQNYQGTALDLLRAGQLFPSTAPTAPGTNLGVNPSFAPPGSSAAGGAQPSAPAQPLAPSAQGTPDAATTPAMFWNMKVPDNLKPFAAEPSFQVPTPTGPKDISQVSVLGDMFPNGQGITHPPAPPPGMGYGKSEPSKKDHDDVAEFQDQAQANQEVYQNLGHLYAVLQGGLKTGKVAPLWTDLASIGKSLNVDISTPANDPENAGTFNKAATRLVFAALSKIKGQPRNMEITGLGQANPNLSLLPATNMSIVNDVLSLGKWEDSRAKLSQQYLTSTGGAPLSDFTARFNQMAPLSGVTEHYKQTAQAAGVRFPGDQTQAPATTIPEGRTATDPNTGHKIRNQGGVVIDLTTGRPLGQ